MAEAPVRIRARKVGELTEINVLMPHPMETGMRTDAAGQLVAAHFITEMTVTINGRTVLAARLGLAVSRDPLLSFRCKGAQRGDPVSVAWVDNAGGRRVDQATVV